MPCNTSFSRTMADPCRSALLPGSAVLALFACLFFLLSRSLLPGEETPAFISVPEKNKTIWVELGRGFPEPGFRQFIDETTPLDVISLTLGKVQFATAWPPAMKPAQLENGERLEIDYNGHQIRDLRRSWMSAAARITLGVPLHPDRMGLQDWPALPGIGPKLAERIEVYRQKNGDFGALQALQEVSGIGPKRIKAWKPFF